VYTCNVSTTFSHVINPEMPMAMLSAVVSVSLIMNLLKLSLRYA